MNIPLSPCVPENLVSRDGFSRPVPRQPAHLHTQAESGAYLRDSSRVQRRHPFMKPPYAIGSVPSLSGHAVAMALPRATRWVFFGGAWLRAGEGIGWLAAGTMPNSLYRMPLVYLSLTCVFCYSCSFLFVVCVFVFFFALIGAW